VGAPDLVWASLLAAGAVVEVWAILNQVPGDTLSERTRTWFHVNTPAGYALFTVVWLAFSAWFLVHILG
jgi:hypothetical protein